MEQKNFSLKISFEESVCVKDAKLLGVDSPGISADMQTNTFTGYVCYYNVFTLSVTYVVEGGKEEKYINMPLFLQPGETKLFFKEAPGQYILSGASSGSYTIFKELQIKDGALIKKIQSATTRLNHSLENEDKSFIQKMQDSINCLQNERRESIYGDFVRKNPHSIMSLYALHMYGDINIENPLEVEKLIKILADSLQKTAEVFALKGKVEEAKKIMVGQHAPAFSQTDTSGKVLNLEELRGQYILINFWASWCRPCRAQHPAFVKLFGKFRNKGFNILGVSIDSQKEAWIKAINDDHLDWLHVSDLKLWQNEAAVVYNISSVPQNYLLDKEGKIIAKNLTDQELSTMLDQITAE